MLRNIFNFKEGNPHSESTEFRNLITYICVVNISISAVYSVINIQNDISNLQNIIWGIGSLTSILLLKLKQKNVLSAHVFLLTNACYLSYLVAMFHDFPYTIILWAPVYVLVSVYLVGAFAGFMWSLAAITGASFMIFWGGDLFPANQKLDTELTKVITVVSMLLTFVATFAASILFYRYIRNLLMVVEQSNNELQIKQKQIQQHVRDKETLVSVVCHDIANPLTNILFSVNMLKEDPENLPKWISRMERASDSIEEIVSSVRKFQAIQSGKAKIELSEVSLVDVFEKAKATFQEKLEAKNLDLFLEKDEDLEPIVLADELSLSNSVINNLISNAIKFSEKGSKIIVQIVNIDDHIQVRIKDFGIGIPEGLAKQLFRPDTMTSRKGTSGESGTGFGLPITKAFMEVYGGSIDVVSKTPQSDDGDHGTTFLLDFQPRKSAESENQPTKKTSYG